MEWASSRQIVLSMCESHKPDLVIFDTALTENPDGNIIAVLKKRYPVLPIIALISMDSKTNNKQGIENFDEFIEKPIKTGILLETINKYLVSE